MRRLTSTGLSLIAALIAGLATACNDGPTEVPSRDDGPGVALATGSTPSGAVITTDKDDYAPGETVILTGHGWAPAEVVDLLLAEDPQTHEPLNWSVQADDNGAFTDSTFIAQDHDLGVTFTLIATGPSSGVAQTTFTDGTLSLTITGLTPANNSFSPGTVTLDGQVSGTNNPSNAETNVRVAIRQGSTSGGTKVWEHTYNAGTIQQSGNFNASTTWDGTNNQGSPGNVPEGEYGARMYSNALTEASASGNRLRTIVVDRSAPAVSGLTLTPNSVLGGATVAAGAAAADVFTQVDQVNWELRNSADAVVLSGAMTKDGGSNGDKTWQVSTSFTAPSAPGTYKFCLYPQDKAGNVPASFASLPTANCATLTVTSANRKPLADAGTYGDQDEGAEITLDGSGSSDPDGDAITSYQWSIVSFTPPAGKTGQCSFKNGTDTGVSPVVICNDNGTLVVGLVVSDGSLDSDQDQATITIKNVPPSITAVTVTPNVSGYVYPITSQPTINATYTDPGSNDQLTCKFEVFDYLNQEVGTDRTCGSGLGIVTDAGVYDIKVTVTDDDGGSDDATVQIVIYDPSAGFVTGGGWINSAAGAYTPDPSLYGKATFGFVSKYLKGANVPTGSTQFVFHAENGSGNTLDFHSNSFEWLVVNSTGTRAQYKGIGAIEGLSGTYKFILTALDGKTGGEDKFRIQIFAADASDPIYDNGTEQGIGSGSIVIQAKK